MKVLAIHVKILERVSQLKINLRYFGVQGLHSQLGVMKLF